MKVLCFNVNLVGITQDCIFDVKGNKVDSVLI
jgi:hypothetical protein